MHRQEGWGTEEGRSPDWTLLTRDPLGRRQLSPNMLPSVPSPGPNAPATGMVSQPPLGLPEWGPMVQPQFMHCPQRGSQSSPFILQSPLSMRVSNHSTLTFVQSVGK